MCYNTKHHRHQLQELLMSFHSSISMFELVPLINCNFQVVMSYISLIPSVIEADIYYVVLPQCYRRFSNSLSYYLSIPMLAVTVIVLNPKYFTISLTSLKCLSYSASYSLVARDYQEDKSQQHARNHGPMALWQSKSSAWTVGV